MKEMEVCSGRKALFAIENATSTIFFLDTSSRTYGIALTLIYRLLTRVNY